MNPDDLAEQSARDTIWDATPVRRCRGPCGRMLPLDSFYKVEHYADGYRSACKDCMRAQSREAYQERPSRRPEPKLNVGPFRSWLAGRMRLATEAGDVRPDWRSVLDARGQTTKQWAVGFAMDANYLARVLEGRYEHVLVDTVDRVLLRDWSTNLQDLYPELYPDDDVDAQEAA